ncbi:MAG TPA: SRPBCC family protein [Acidimicrobiales bacterium]|jgi:uncharacterized protein YndB with AHSA1/START domain|nr:SRPBCC family protein [Acidimicrobiales bacterium]
MTDRTAPHLGMLEHRDGAYCLRFTRRFPHPPDKVFRALTEPEHVSAWFPTDIVGDRVAGAPLTFVFRNGKAPSFDGELRAYEPPHLVEYQWGPDDVLRFELRADGDGTVLDFVNTFEPVGKGARDGAGWHACLDTLEHHLDGTTPEWDPEQHWTEVHDHYLESFPPEASTIGPPEGWNADA